jgi:hypothetical protein
MKIPLLIAAAVIAAPMAAVAQPLDLSLRPVGAAPTAPVATPAGAPAKPTPDLANLLDPLAPTKQQVSTRDTPVIAKTSVEHRFARRDDVTGSFGFLCGLQPGHTESGVAAAYGSDPHGRFVGAKFSIAFK